MEEASDPNGNCPRRMETNFDELQEVPSFSGYQDNTSVNGFTHNQPKRQRKTENIKCKESKKQKLSSKCDP